MDATRLLNVRMSGHVKDLAASPKETCNNPAKFDTTV